MKCIVLQKAAENLIDNGQDFYYEIWGSYICDYEDSTVLWHVGCVAQ
jgi:hypothetical protein